MGLRKIAFVTFVITTKYVDTGNHCNIIIKSLWCMSGSDYISCKNKPQSVDLSYDNIIPKGLEVFYSLFKLSNVHNFV